MYARMFLIYACMALYGSCMPLCNQHRLIYVSTCKHDRVIAAALMQPLMYLRLEAPLMYVGPEGLIADVCAHVRATRAAHCKSASLQRLIARAAHVSASLPQPLIYLTIYVYATNIVYLCLCKQ